MSKESEPKNYHTFYFPEPGVYEQLQKIVKEDMVGNMSVSSLMFDLAKKAVEVAEEHRKKFTDKIVGFKVIREDL